MVSSSTPAVQQASGVAAREEFLVLKVLAVLSIIHRYVMAPPTVGADSPDKTFSGRCALQADAKVTNKTLSSQCIDAARGPPPICRSLLGAPILSVSVSLSTTPKRYRFPPVEAPTTQVIVVSQDRHLTAVTRYLSYNHQNALARASRSSFIHIFQTLRARAPLTFWRPRSMFKVDMQRLNVKKSEKVIISIFLFFEAQLS